MNTVSEFAPKESSIKTEKKPRLARYEGVAAKLLGEYDPNRLFVDISAQHRMRFSTLDLFAGAGGLSQGFKQAGFDLVGAVELVEVAAQTHARNFPDVPVFNGDISLLNFSDFFGNVNVDVVAGGPPCQGFSVAGKRNPDDPRNKLFYEFVRVVDEARPDYFVMENVPGILTMSNGKVREAIVEAFHEIGYSNVSIAVLEAANYGVPQMRSRAIFIGNRHGLPNFFPAPTHSVENYVSIEQAIGDLAVSPRNELNNHEWTKHSKAFEARIAQVKPGHSLYETFADAYKRQYLGVPAMTIKENHGGTHLHYELNRCISAREMARLQSFPDDFFFEGGMKKAMWQIGNAVPPLLAEAIARALSIGLAWASTGVAPEYQRRILQDEATNEDSLF